MALPFPLCVSPFAESVQARLERWATESGLTTTPAAKSRFAASQFGIYASYMQADAPQEKLVTYAKFLAWLFLVNDQHGENVYSSPAAWHQAVHPLLTVVRTGHADPSRLSAPAVQALANIVAIVYPCMSAAWIARFAEHCEQLFAAIEPESRRRQQRRIPPVETYVTNRRVGSAGFPLIDLFEYSAGSELPLELRDHPAYRELASATTDVMAWTNDITSLDKELAAGEVDNFVLVMQHAHGLSRRRAIRSVEERVLQRIDEFRRADRDLVRALDAMHLSEKTRITADFCRRSLRHWMIGNAVWAQHNPRYSTHPTTSVDRDAVEDLLRSNAE
ncbi:terpene synthase family protein [Nocardia thraciensis]